MVTWTPPPRAYDLVCVLYLQLPALERRQALGHAVDAVRPGGTLLVVGHDLLNLTQGWGGPPQPDVLFTPDDLVSEIGGRQVEKAERVRRRRGRRRAARGDRCAGPSTAALTRAIRHRATSRDYGIMPPARRRCSNAIVPCAPGSTGVASGT